VNNQIITTEQANAVHSYIDQRISLINKHRPASLVHHDLADHNLMYRADQLTGVFDWETAIAGDPILDLASCPTWKSHYDKRDALLAGYQSITSLPDDFEELEKLYRLRTMLWKGYYALRINIMNDARKQRVEAALKSCGI
jgi:aminoglycoside phosphotransferase (APT) family kinase protein